MENSQENEEKNSVPTDKSKDSQVKEQKIEIKTTQEKTIPKAPEDVPLKQVMAEEIQGSTEKKHIEKKRDGEEVKFKYKPQPANFEGIEPEMKRTMNYFENDPEQEKKKQKTELQSKKPTDIPKPKTVPTSKPKSEVPLSTKKIPSEKIKNGGESEDIKIEKSRRNKNVLVYGLIGLGVIVLLVGGLFGVELYDTYLRKVSTEKILRGDVSVVLKVNSDANFSQYQLLDEHLKKFPGYSLLAKELDETGEGKTPSEFLKDKLSEHNLNFQQDIQAVLGGEVYVLLPNLKTLEQSFQRRITMLKGRSRQAFDMGLQRKRDELGLIAESPIDSSDDQSRVLGLTTDYYSVGDDQPSIDPLDFIMGAQIKDLKEAKRVLEKISADSDNYEVKEIKYQGYIYFKVENLKYENKDDQIFDISTTYHALVGGNWIMGTDEEDVKEMIMRRKNNHILSIVKGPLQKKTNLTPILAENHRFIGVSEEIMEGDKENILSVYFNVNFKKFFEIDEDKNDYDIPQYFKYPEDLVGGLVFRAEKEGLVFRSVTNQISFEGVANESFSKGLVEKIPTIVDTRYTDVLVENEDVKKMYYSFKKENLTKDGLEEWNNLIKEVNDGIGIEIERDIIDQIEGNAAFGLFAKRELEPEMAFFVEIKDKDKVVDSARKLIEMIKTTYIGLLSMGSGMYMSNDYDENGMYVGGNNSLVEQQDKANAAVEAVMESQLIQTEAENGTIYSYKLPDTLFSFDFGFSENVLILGSHYSAVNDLLGEFQSNTAPKIATDETFQNITQKVYPQGYSKLYVNTLGVWNSIEYYLKTYFPTDSQEEKDSIFAAGSVFRTINSISGVDAISGDGKSVKSALFLSIKELPAEEKARAEKIIDLSVSGSVGSARGRARVALLQSTLASVTTIASLCVNDGGNVKAPLNKTTGGGMICDNSSIISESWPSLVGQGMEDAGYQYSTTNNVTISAIDGSMPVVSCTVRTGSCVRY